MRSKPFYALVCAFTAAGLLTGISKASAENPSEFVFAHTTMGPWTLKAVTEVEGTNEDGTDDPYPTVKEINCSIVANGLDIFLTRSGGVRIRVEGTNQTATDQESFSVFNIIRIDIGSVHYAAKSVEIGHAQVDFSDVHYPHSDDEIILTYFRGYLAVRRSDRSPWLNIDTLLDSMASSEKMKVGYRVSNNDAANTWHLAKTTVPLRGLGDAINWCEAQFVSPSAFRLHGPR